MDFAARYRVDGDDFDLRKRPTRDGDAIDRDEAKKVREADIAKLHEIQERLYAESRRSLLIVFQALDAAGKDSTIEHVMSGINPQGVTVTSFKQPSEIELAHDFLWRCQSQVPRAGEIAIFNRSHYEDVLVVRVHPELLANRRVDPDQGRHDEFWLQRFDAIRAWESQLVRNGTEILKFYLHVSLEEQRERLLARADTPEKNWKFSPGDVAERDFYEDYLDAYQRMLPATSTEDAPWFVIPADQKWLMRTAVAGIVCDKLEQMDPRFPALSPTDKAAMDEAAAKLRAEG